MRNRLLTTLTAAAIAAAALACEGRTSGFLVTGPGGAGGVRVRLMNAVTSTPSLDFLVDGQVAATVIPFGGASPYTSVTVGSHRLQARASTTGTTLLDFTRDLSTEGSFSLVPAPGLSQFGALFIADDPTPASGQARLRVIDVAAAPGDVSVYITSPTADLASATPTIALLPFGTASGYVAVAPGTYRVRITRAGSPGEVLVDVTNVTVMGGSVRTFLVTDSPSGGFPTAMSTIVDAG